MTDPSAPGHQPDAPATALSQGRGVPAALPAQEAITQRSRRARLSVIAAPALTALLVLAACGQSASTSASSSNSPGSAPAGTATYPEPDRAHVTGPVRYDHSPPVGGNHSAAWLNCGIYDRPVANENVVHSMEHGAVWITYLPSLSPAELERLRALVTASYDGTDRYVILSPYPGQGAPVIASAWGHQLTLRAVTDPGLRSFIHYFRQGPQDLEPGAPCSRGTGSPLG